MTESTDPRQEIESVRDHLADHFEDLKESLDDENVHGLIHDLVALASCASDEATKLIDAEFGIVTRGEEE